MKGCEVTVCKMVLKLKDTFILKKREKEKKHVIK